MAHAVPSTSAALLASPPLFDIRPTPHSYLGAHSLSFIPAGTLVLSETPLFVLDAPFQIWMYQRSMQSGGGQGPTPVDGEEDEEVQRERWEKENGRKFTENDWLEKAILALLGMREKEQVEEFRKLANTRDELPPALGIFTTNAVATKADLGGMFLNLSRFNSSCRPNLSRPIWDPTTRRINTYALHDIEPSTELVWPYLSRDYEFDSIAQRREQFNNVFGFTCCCKGCLLEGEEKKESERRTRELRYLKEARGGEKGDPKVRRRMVELALEEGLWEAATRIRESLEAEEEVDES
ncbi:hypothetical protein MNV49_005988 [Pseudohyphozyma bogoriensis]|nr:hypothetical protein MNV49_005988 [Pseudohyphozyma bogoriensis]